MSNNPPKKRKEDIVESEEQYRKQKMWSSYSVLGAEYEPKYDTGEVKNDKDVKRDRQNRK